MFVAARWWAENYCGVDSGSEGSLMRASIITAAGQFSIPRNAANGPKIVNTARYVNKRIDQYLEPMLPNRTARNRDLGRRKP